MFSFYVYSLSALADMPKSVDIYVLSTKIGQGQFGDVFRGFNKTDGTQVAIKVMRRDKIKGKFNELLQSEIQVLRSCKNNNIVRLIDIKKTASNIYLVLEYCNEGDLLHYLRSKQKLPEEEAIQYLVQMLNAFETLVRNKIMHRDFKLANVLKHDGVIKVADFGFAKLMGSQDQMVETILGSPLNMAPQVLDRKHYNSKADIWSIGVAFYELLFGKVPFSANNVIDLIKKIKGETLLFPYKVHPQVQDVLRRMLVIDPAKRIEWSDLFKHPVTRVLEQRLEDDLRKSMLGSELSIELSKFYIKTNKVVQTLNDIRIKKDLNGFVRKAIGGKKNGEYQGAFIRRKAERTNLPVLKGEQLALKSEVQLQTEENDYQKKIAQLSQQGYKLQRLKANCMCILHYRNIYAFLGHLAEELIQTHLNHYYQCLSFLIIRKALTRVSALLQAIKKREVGEVVDWVEFQQSPYYDQILEFILAEESIFSTFHEGLSLKVMEEGTLQTFEEDLMISGKFTLQETNQRIYERVLRAYMVIVLKEADKIDPIIATHVLQLMDSLRVDAKFVQIDFDFSDYYETFTGMDTLVLKSNAVVKMQQLLSSKI